MTRRLIFFVIVGLVLAAGAAPQSAPKPMADLLNNLEFRNIGPAIMGGRIDDFAVVESNPATFYVATASGGVWKTTNNGITFEPVFDNEAVSTIGDITVAPSDPAIVYAGTGEPNNRQSSSWGNGVYKSMNGGKSWIHLGLKDTHHIGRIVVHPKNPDVLYVAALGHLWGPNKERGLYKSADGGKTWTNSKFINEDTGFVDVAMDPESPQILYAASYQRRRTPFGYNGGGPGSGLWRTVDGGASWMNLHKHAKGLPSEGDIGRIAVNVYRKDPNIVYSLIEHATQGGVYRSEDKGETWTKMSDTNPRPSYYSKIHVDPANDQRIWVLGAQMYFSDDGGKTFRTNLVQRIHGDFHALWINPADSNHILAGSDGGIHISYDRGRSWDYANTVALAQFYEIGVDMRKPYYVYGGLQDNGSWAGPSRTLWTGGITNEDWFRVGGGDGFYVVVDPTDHNIVYVESQDGNVARLNTKTFERRVLRPEPPEGERYRFNWNSPILISPHDPKTVYYGGNRLFGSKDRGDTWSLTTPDLTTNPERDKMTIFGKTAREMLSRNDGVVHFGTITTISESPLKPGILWAGTDDGNLQVTRDGGASWANLSVRGVPKGTYVSRVEASRQGEGAAYVAFDGHRANDYKVYIFRTNDFGRTWESVAGNIPDGGTVSVIREHPKNPAHLLAGTEYGLWASWDGGAQWSKIKSKLPTVPVDDIVIHPREGDLVLGTHGRGVWILDDWSPLAQLNGSVWNSDLHLFDIRTATQYRLYGHKGNTGHKTFAARNPPEGALISYYLKTKPAEKEEVKITISDASGKVVRELRSAKEAGVNRANWDLRHESPVRPDPNQPSGGFFGAPRGPLVPPGAYQVKVAVGSASAVRNVMVEEDPRIEISAADRDSWYQASQAAAGQWAKIDAATRASGTLRRQITELQASLRRNAKANEAVGAAVKALAEKIDGVARRLSSQEALGFAGAPLAGRPDPLGSKVRGLYSAISSITAPPTSQQKELMSRLEKQVNAIAGEVQALTDKEVPALNKLLLDNGIGRLDPNAEAGPPAGRRR